MDSLPFLLSIGAVVGVVTVVKVAGEQLRRIFSVPEGVRRGVRREQEVKVAALEEGRVARVTGVVRRDEDSIVSPLSKRTCLLYVAVAEQVSPRHGHWEDLYGTRAVNFLIEDSSGAVRVLAGRCEAALAMDWEERISEIHEPVREVVTFLAERGRPVKARYFNRRLQINEGVLRVGDRVSVVGLVVRDGGPGAGRPGSDGTYREAPARQVIGPLPDGAVLIEVL